jgi:teichuronic acid biosynthesis glycosyltransferase TuaH
VRVPEPPRVAVLSPEAWDQVWRRNQHFAAELVSSGAVSSLLWVSPPGGGLSLRASSRRPVPGVEVVEPPLVVPRRWGGHRVLGWWLKRRLAGVDVVWVNDPVAGAAALRLGIPAVYDITDDWRSMPQDVRACRQIVAAEDVLARRARTVVCSPVLAERWRSRYGIDAVVIPNAVDAASIRAALRRPLEGPGPHAAYVGTLHANRLDVPLVAQLAAAWPGTVHLVGPNGLDAADRDRLTGAGVRLPGPIPAADVPSWLVSADVLICPHLVDDFTLSLDAIKAHEYLATDRPIIATRSSGFQALTAPGLAVVDRSAFAAAALEMAGAGPCRREPAPDWADRAGEFGRVLLSARSERPGQSAG